MTKLAGTEVGDVDLEDGAETGGASGRTERARVGSKDGPGKESFACFCFPLPFRVLPLVVVGVDCHRRLVWRQSSTVQKAARLRVGHCARSLL
jgi:hypothetical protein